MLDDLLVTFHWRLLLHRARAKTRNGANGAVQSVKKEKAQKRAVNRIFSSWARSGHQRLALVVRDCRVPSVHYGTWARCGTGRNLHNLDVGEGRHGDVAHRCHAFLQHLVRALTAAAAARANAKRFGQFVEGFDAKVCGTVNLTIGDLVADTDVHNSLLWGAWHRHATANERQNIRDQ
jgi:hypothetical protein